MKYTIKNINTQTQFTKYLFFWGHQPSRSGEMSKNCFSQWWEVSFTVDGIDYKSAEHYMMAEKARLFGDDEILQKILTCRTPAEAKKLGREVRNFESKIWEIHSYKIVKRANFHKFLQNEDLKNFLLSSQKRILVEASPVDTIWGIGLAEDHKDAQNPKKMAGEKPPGICTDGSERFDSN